MRSPNYRLIIILLAAAMTLSPAANSLAHFLAYSLDSRKVIQMDMLAERAGMSDIVFVGEDHDTMPHHDVQLEVIKTLENSGANIAVGLEMFMAGDQEVLDRWVRGEMSEDEFRKVYTDYWRLPWKLYKDIFLYSRDRKIPMIGLNVPKEVTLKVAREGFNSLSTEDLKQLPVGISCDVDDDYMEFIRMAHNAHGSSKKEFKNFCEAQLIWDKVMAWYVVDYLRKNPGTTVVVLAGKTHAWKKGIPDQVKKQSDLTYTVIFPLKPNNTPGMLTTDYVDYLIDN